MRIQLVMLLTVLNEMVQLVLLCSCVSVGGIHRKTSLRHRGILVPSLLIQASSVAILDFFYKKCLPHIPSYLKNSANLIQLLQTTIIPPSDNVYLISLDVKSLYTTIPQEEGINVLMQHNNITGLPKFITRQLLNFILKNYIFTFDGQPYKQVTGIAIGTPLAPTLANIFVAHQEDFLRTQNKNHMCTKGIFIVWTHPKADFETFLQNLNNHHPTIKYEHTISESSIDYLDLTIYKYKDFQITRKLSFKTHLKPANSFQYVQHDSHHPPNIKTAIVKGKLLRYKRQCSDPTQFNILKQQLFQHFTNRGYPSKIIKKHHHKQPHQQIKERHLSLQHRV